MSFLIRFPSNIEFIPFDEFQRNKRKSHSLFRKKKRTKAAFVEVNIICQGPFCNFDPLLLVGRNQSIIETRRTDGQNSGILGSLRLSECEVTLKHLWLSDSAKEERSVGAQSLCRKGG